jgi:hypothetical protein
MVRCPDGGVKARGAGPRGEENDTFVDPGGGARQVYTEDCAVCCRPNLITATLDAEATRSSR